MLRTNHLRRAVGGASAALACLAALGCSQTVSNEPARRYDPGKEAEQKAIEERAKATEAKEMAERMPPEARAAMEKARQQGAGGPPPPAPAQ